MPSLPDTVECTEVLYTDGLTPPRQLVFRGRIKGDEEDVCIKIFNLPEHLEVLDEMLQDLNFDFGVQSKVVNVQDARWVVMDYCDCSIGDVICLIKELSEEQIQAIAHGALIAMQALHSTGLAHTNVKPNNMLVQEGQLLLGDQGLTQLSTLRANPHPARVIPEGQDCFDMPPADVWALGMSIIEMADRIPPFHGLPEDEVERRLQEDRVPEMQSKRFDENAALQDFLARCLDLDPEERATCDELLAHPWLASVSIESSEDVFDSMVDSFKAALQEWYDANGKLVPRVQLRQLFDDQVAGALKSSSVTTDIPPTRLADPPAEGFTQIPLSLLPEEESEPVVLKDKTAGEFPLALPDTEARPQNYVIQNCSKVEVFLLGPNLNVVLQRVSNSTIFIGPCKGRVKLEGLDNCQVAVAAKRVEMERCRGVEFLSLYTEEPLRSVGCDLDTISLIPWHLAYPKQKDMMSLAGLNPFTNRWNEHETSDMSGDAGELRLLVDPYRLFHITAFPLPGMSGGGDPQQAVYLLKDVEAPVRPDDHDCIYISSLKQSRVVKRPGELEGRRVHIENSNRSEFLLLDSTSRVDLVNLNACQAVVGPTDHLELKGLVGCVVIAACAELKIVQCSEICIFLWCATPPIVANCVELELAYFNVSWPLLDKMVQQRGWDTMPNMYEHMRDASPRSSIEAKLHNKPMYRNIPILNETGDDFLAPINYPFDESNLQRDMTIADFDPVYGSTHRKTLDVAVKSISSDSFFDITMKSPTDYPERFKTQDHVAIRHVAHARILHLADTLPGNVSVETVDACEVYLLDATETVLLKGASNSTIVVGPVAGQLLIEQCKGCTIVGAASQIVVTGSTECRLSVWCSHDFIVHSSSVEVAPWNIVYPGLREQAVATFGEERLAMESRHTKVYDLSRDDVRFPEPHVLVYPLRDVRLEVLQVEDLEVSPFPFVPVPEPARVPGAESPAAGAANSPEPASPCSPEPAKVSSPNTLSYLSGERVERGMGELQGGAFEADHAERCEVVVADVSDSVTLSDCSDCSFVIGPSKGAVVLTNLSNCKVWCVCPEFSATGLVDCKVYLLSTAAPVFTQCSDTTLSPFNARLPKLPLLLEQAGIDPAVSAAHLPVLNDSSVAQPDYVGVLEMQSFVLQKSEHDQTESVPAIEQRLQPPVPQAEKITAPEPEVPEAPEKPEGGTSSPAGESVYGRARREALEGVNPSGPWDVAGVALPPQKRWEKSEVTATGVSFFKGKTVVVPDSDVKREQQVELNQLHDCRVVVIGSCGSYMIDDCTNCEFILGPCSGSMFFRDCADLCVTGACMQLRMRDVSTGDFFVHTETDPAVESSTNITLRPLNLKQPSLVTAFEESRLKATENRFRHAADFNTFSDPKATEGFKIPDWVGSLPMRSMEILGHGVVGVPDGVEDMLTGKIEGGESLEKGKSFAMGLSQEEAARMHRERQGLQDTEEPKQKEADSDSDLTLDSDMVSGKSSKKAAAELAVEAAPTPPPPAVESPPPAVPADTIDPRKLSTATSADGPADDSVDMRDNDSNLTLDSDLHSGRSSKRTMELSASNLVPPPVPVPGKPVAKLPGTILRRLVETPVTLPHAHKFTRGGEIEANLLRANEELVKVRSDLADIEGLESRVDALLAGLGLA